LATAPGSPRYLSMASFSFIATSSSRQPAVSAEHCDYLPQQRSRIHPPGREPQPHSEAQPSAWTIQLTCVPAHDRIQLGRRLATIPAPTTTSCPFEHALLPESLAVGRQPENRGEPTLQCEE
jgi:hypothetical protein